MTATGNAIVFDVEAQFGNQSFLLLVDTGSSDTWVVKTDFQCIDATYNSNIPQEKCLFGPTYDVPTDMQYVKNQTFGVQYGTGIALGKVGFENITIGGITVPKQKIGIVDRSTDKGDGINSGILGLGYPPLTSAHYGSTLDNSTLLLNRAVYDPLFVSMYKKGLVDSWYSMAIERLPKNVSTGPGGWLGLGELPPVTHSDEWAVAPIEVTKGLPDLYTGGVDQITLMTLNVDGIAWGSQSNQSRTTNSTSFQAVVDSGNQMNMLPQEVADEINAEFKPPAVYNEEAGVYAVDCDAEAPTLGIGIDGKTFWHQSADMIIQDEATGLCYSSLNGPATGSGISLHFLGDAFLKNVVSVFDFGKDEMRFADGETESLSLDRE
ncbi:aspartic peptidase domain-containing protein [Dactylonectria macrodidyma]|uniref:Aspartic peptidase domain-containing protein n=1 Tax=Dactylonectria macrodidyma TaxID=307937 RepID=A0A9P9FL46_9HYPO|nr:aspartic peptidase domain-containing protein [Dactylonectria macrodidyma]